MTYDENGVEKQKFKVGELVRASSCLNRSGRTKWDNEDYPPYGEFWITGHYRFAWQHKDIGIVTRIHKPIAYQNYWVQVHFIQTNIKIILKQRELKWAAKS